MGGWRLRRRRFLYGLIIPLVRALSFGIGRLTWRRAQGVGRSLGRLGWFLARRDRRRTLDHLEIAFPDLSGAERTDLGRRSFAHLGCVLCECLFLWHRDLREVERYVEIHGGELVEAVRAEGHPIIILTGHCGNWEVLGAAINAWGLPLSAMARGMHDDRINDLLVAMRAHFGSKTIVRGAPGAARQLLGTLRSGGALGMLIDQDTKVDGVWVDFFGRPAYTPVGAAQIALRQEARVIPAFITRRDDGLHDLFFQPALDLPDDLTAATAEMTRAIEEQIRRSPEQWVWMHRRWRTRPPEETGGRD